MSKKSKKNNTVDEKNYGGTSIFYGSLLLLDLALIVYNLYFMKIFKEIKQTYYPVSSDDSFLEKIADRYFSFFAQFFGYYPSTKVLAVTIPLAFVFLIWFIDDFSKYLKQRERKKAAAGIFEMSDQTQETMNVTDQEAIDGQTQETTDQPADETEENKESSSVEETESKTEDTGSDKPDSGDNSENGI